MSDSTAVYLHIPFCKTKCAYCDFNTYAGIEPLIPPYIKALCAELRTYPAGLRVHTLNFGGGTPSLLSASELGAIIDACRQHFDVSADAEVSIEANPDGLDLAYFEAIRAIGVNRISFGVQSFHNSELQMLTRRHDTAGARRAFEAARAAGFDNLNLDFMYGLPGQSLEQWASTVREAIACRPEHLSLYGLTLYEELPLAARVRQGSLPDQDDDLTADMYELAEAALAKAGYEQYEISNWSLGGKFICKHNLAYWRSTGYIGLGAGAHSYFDDHRYSNELSPRKYVEKALGGQNLAVEREFIDAGTGQSGDGNPRPAAERWFRAGSG